MSHIRYALGRQSWVRRQGHRASQGYQGYSVEAHEDASCWIEVTCWWRCYDSAEMVVRKKDGNNGECSLDGDDLSPEEKVCHPEQGELDLSRKKSEFAEVDYGNSPPPSNSGSDDDRFTTGYYFEWFEVILVQFECNKLFRCYVWILLICNSL